MDPGAQSDSSSTEGSPHAKLWREYPAAFFPNWTSTRLERSGIAKVLKKRHVETYPCVVYQIDVGHNGHFADPEHVTVDATKYDDFWTSLKEHESEKRLRALFVENLSGPVLQMLGAMYQIEPFFFSSSLNWIPSRYQENVKKRQSDHITITLTFLKSMPNPMTAPNTPVTGSEYLAQMISKAGSATIDTQAPLVLRSSDKILLIDQIAFHMVRRKDGSTIISYHPTPKWRSTSARYLHSRVRFVGESVYWQSIFKYSPDPTFVLLSMLWYALYAWDEALESLYLHICWLESRVLVNNDIQLTRELHVIRASLLHYASLLESFRKTIIFVRATPNPAMEDHPDLEESKMLMERECDTLVSEIERLEMFRRMQEMRLDNVMNLAFSTVSFEDSRVMKRMAEASLRDGTAMKQISYLTMVFLPASFVATVFGMNIQSLQDGSRGTVPHYLAVALPLTAVSIWIIMALHTTSSRFDDEPPPTFLNRLRWPFQALQELIRVMKRKARGKAHIGIV
jgi:Mg2+ and Co2+ transporter CorA